MDLAVAELGGGFDEFREVGGVRHVTGDGDGAVRVYAVDGFGDFFAFFCKAENGVSF